MASGKPGASSRQGSAEKHQIVPHTRIENEGIIEETYEFGAKLGQGSFGVVRAVIHKESEEQWACKAVNKEKAGSSAIKLLEREVAILKRVQHEHIILLKEVYETSKKMYLVMELCEGGELADVLKEVGTFSEDQVKKIMSRLASAIAYLHKNDMVHRDLKLENILLSKNPKDSSDNLYIKVTDFGLSVVKGGVGYENMMMDFCGTPMYMAPEIIDNKGYSEKCDVWAMGVIMFTLIQGTAPFTSKDEEKLYEIIKQANVRDMFEEQAVWRNISDEAKDCICEMLKVDPAHRITAIEMTVHPWITGNNNKRPPNVLEMMKEFRMGGNQSESDDISINGSSTSCLTPEKDDTQPTSTDKTKTNELPADGSNGANNRLKRNSGPTSKPETDRISVPSYQRPLQRKYGTPQDTGFRSKSKSPVDSDAATPSRGRTSTSTNPPRSNPQSRTSNGASKQTSGPVAGRSQKKSSNR